MARPLAIYLVSCVAKKQPTRCRARDLYVSPWFRKARTYVERTGRPWFILSAKHGLVRPDDQVDPYEMTLLGQEASKRRDWARRVLRELAPQLTGVDRVVILAGKRYHEFLVPGLRAIGVQVDTPLAGLRIGEQLRWFAKRQGDDPEPAR